LYLCFRFLKKGFVKVDCENTVGQMCTKSNQNYLPEHGRAVFLRSSVKKLEQFLQNKLKFTAKAGKIR